MVFFKFFSLSASRRKFYLIHKLASGKVLHCYSTLSAYHWLLTLLQRKLLCLVLSSAPDPVLQCPQKAGQHVVVLQLLPEYQSFHTGKYTRVLNTNKFSMEDWMTGVPQSSCWLCDARMGGGGGFSRVVTVNREY
jgi:hypothetical protein